MISIDEALRLVLDNLPARRVEEIDFQAALGRVLAADVAATMNIPPFHRSSMDGFAVRAADVQAAPVRLRNAGEVRAGGGATVTVGPGEAVAIMTGAPVPEGADAVQMVELTERSADGSEVVILRPVKPGENIAPLGSEASAGEIVLKAGCTIGPAEIAVLATFGVERVGVYKRPRVALAATGDELVEVSEQPRLDQIRNSNAYSLSAQLRLLGVEPEYLGIAPDTKEALRRMLGLGLEREVVILTGGVSMGEYDFVKDVFHELGLQILFTKVAMKPGKPTVFARKGDKLVFGLPGNPVSTFVAFENFVRPALGRMCGFARPELPRIRGCLLQDMKQKPGRTAFLPAWVAWEQDGWKVEPLRWKGSADIIGFSRANATVIFPGDRDSLRRGENVEAMLLPDFSLRSRNPSAGVAAK
jgi:molybdopterin molybdotransferase